MGHFLSQAEPPRPGRTVRVCQTDGFFPRCQLLARTVRMRHGKPPFSFKDLAGASGPSYPLAIRCQMPQRIPKHFLAQFAGRGLLGPGCVIGV